MIENRSAGFEHSFRAYERLFSGFERIFKATERIFKGMRTIFVNDKTNFYSWILELLYMDFETFMCTNSNLMKHTE